MIFEKLVSGIQGWVSVLILWKPHVDCFIRIQDMLISVKTMKNAAVHGRVLLDEIEMVVEII